MNKNFYKMLCITSLILALVFLVSLGTGTYHISPFDIIKTLFGYGSNLQNTTIFSIRLPRIMVAILVGICLSTSGCILQSVTRNELAESGMIGINAGSALAVVFLISYGTTSYHSELGDLTVFLMPFVSIVGALLSWLLIYTLSNKNGLNPTRLILTGIGINIGINSFISLYQLSMSQGDFNQVLTWTSGSLWGASWKYFYLILPFTIITMILVAYKSKILDALDLGDDIAIGLGVDVNKERKILSFYAVVLAALATSVAGNIAFLGLIAPHIAKKLVGPVHKRQIPISALVSSSIIILADTLSRNLFSPIEIPVGISISVIAVPYFIYLIMKD